MTEHENEREPGSDSAESESEAPPEELGFETTEAAHLAAEQRAFVGETSEGAQELAPRGTTTAGELRQEVGAVLRLPEGGYVDPGDIDIERRDDQTMVINMGPQHPSTHGVLRLMLELDGETVLRTKPIIGYLHTGMEKTGEELTYVQGSTNVTRMDYLSPLHNELVFSLATERPLRSPETVRRASWTPGGTSSSDTAQAKKRLMWSMRQCCRWRWPALAASSGRNPIAGCRRPTSPSTSYCRNWTDVFLPASPRSRTPTGRGA